MLLSNEVPSTLSTRRKFSRIVDTIIKDCQHFNEPHLVSSELQSSYSKVSLIYNQLQTENFSPGYADRLIPRKKSVLDDYLADKEKGPKSWEFRKILDSSPTSMRVLQNSPSYFTFDTVQDDEISQVFGYNKRKFGKKWEKKKIDKNFLSPEYLSAQTSPRYASALKKLKSSDESYKKIEFKPGNFIKQTISVQVEGGKLKLPPIQVKINGISKKDSGHHKGKSMENSKFDYAHKSFDSMEKDQSAVGGNYMKQKRLNESLSPPRDGVAMRKFIIEFMDKSLGIKKKNHFKYEAKFEDPALNDVTGVKERKKLAHGEKDEKRKEEVAKTGRFKEDDRPLHDAKAEEVKEDNQLSPLEVKAKEASEDFRDYLASGYINYNNDLENRLRVQKIVTTHHRYERKMTLINFPPVKKINSESN